MRVFKDDAAIVFCVVVNHTPRVSLLGSAFAVRSGGVEVDGDSYYWHDVVSIAFNNYNDPIYDRWMVRKLGAQRDEYNPNKQRDRFTFSSRCVKR